MAQIILPADSYLKHTSGNIGRDGSLMKAADPSSRDVNWDRPLTILAEGFAQMMDNFVGSRVFPMISVDKESDYFWRYPIGAWSRPEMTDRAENTVATKANFEISTDRYFVDFKAVGHDISDRRRATSRAPLNQDSAITRFLVEQGMIDIELGFRYKYFKTGVWTFEIDGDTTASTAFDATDNSNNDLVYWNNPSATPIQDITRLCADIGEATGRRPNILTVGRRVWDAVRHHPTIVGRIDDGQTTGVANTTKMNAAELFEVDEILVMDAVQNTAAEGKDASNKYIGGNNALLSYRAPNPSPDAEDGSAGYTFVLRNESLIPNAFGMFNGAGMGISRFYDRARRCEVMEIDLAYDQKLSGAQLGVFFNNIIA